MVTIEKVISNPNIPIKEQAADLEAMKLLHEVGIFCALAEHESEQCLDKIIDAAITLTGADKGNIQLFDVDSGTLRIAAQRGFAEAFLKYFARVDKNAAAVCGAALRSGGRVVVEDVTLTELFAGHQALKVLLNADVRAVQSKLLISTSGQLLGIISTHFRSPHRPSERDLRLIDLLARQTADYLERRQAAEAVRKSEEQFRAFVTASSDVVYRMSPDWSEMRHLQGSEFIGGTDEPSGQWLEKYIHPDDQPLVMKAVNEAIRTKSKIEMEHRVLRGDGSLGWTFSRAIPILSDDGEIVEWIGTASDVTRRKEAEAALREADRRKDEFLATLAHELRNPLAPMHNALHLIRLARSNPATLSQASAMMERQLQQMKRLVDDLLDVSRISRDKLELRKEFVDLASVVKRATETSRPLIEAAQQELLVSLPPEPVLLDADPVRLAQAFSNLLNNAAKYSERGGRIWFRVEHNADEVVVRVKDTGIGIPAEKIPNIFDMFVQVDRSLERSQGGLGIGLTLVKQLVQMHGGTIEAESAGLGKGCEFTVRLAVAVTPGIDRMPEKQNKDLTRSEVRRRILVVDDNQDSADSLAMMLKLLGHDVSSAHDGLEAVAAARRFMPQLAFLDLGMPRMNGYDAARLIRQQPECNGMILVALTGWGQEEDKRRSYEAGFDFHMVKPIDFTAVESLIADL
jgi:PAS domain S-box-containing protein